MRSKVIFVFLLLSLILFYGCSEQQDKSNFSVPSETEISGEISVDTVWSLDKSPYIVVDDVLVQRGVTLTIEPQVEIRFERDKGLTVKGILIADGSAGFNPSDESEFIKFTSNRSMPDMGDWQGIKFDNTNDDESLLKYVKIEYAKTGIDCYSSSPMISDNFIEFNETGIRLTDTSSTIIHNIIRSNINGIIIYPRPPHISFNTISQNETGIIIHSWGKVRYNNFIDNEGYSILSKFVRPSSNYNATNNWWDTTKKREIEKQVYDKDDSNNLNDIFYIPYSKSPISDAYPRFQEN